MTQMVHPQLPPPQSLFRGSTNAVGCSNNSTSPSCTGNDQDSGGPLPFLPNYLPPTDCHPQYRMVSGETPSPHSHPQYYHHYPHHHHHHSNLGIMDGAAAMPYASRNDTEPHSHPPMHYAPFTTSHPAMMVMMKRQPSFPPSSMFEEPPSSSSYSSPQHFRATMTNNPTTGASDTSAPHSNVKPQRSYDLESQMLPTSNHHKPMMMTMGQPQSEQKQYFSSTRASMTPAGGTKRDFTSTAPVPNHWTTPAPPPPPLNSMPPHNHGTPRHNNSNCGSDSQHNGNVGAANHTTPYHPIHRCSSYGSASCSSNHNTTQYDAGPVPHQAQHPPQFVPLLPRPPPQQQMVSSGPYNSRSVSWSNHEPLAQWIPYGGPPVSDIRMFRTCHVLLVRIIFSIPQSTDFPLPYV